MDIFTMLETEHDLRDKVARLRLGLRKIDDALEGIEQTIHGENAETIAVIRSLIDSYLSATSS